MLCKHLSGLNPTKDSLHPDLLLKCLSCFSSCLLQGGRDRGRGVERKRHARRTAVSLLMLGNMSRLHVHACMCVSIREMALGFSAKCIGLF